MDDIWNDFRKLARDWQDRPGTDGGIAALSGFSFQLTASLLEMIRSQPNPDHPSTFIEHLSDLVTREGTQIVVTQAKRTLRGASLRDAASELFGIY